MSALDGIRVVELATMITGPLTGMMLADLGAEVVKVENPDGGDPFRSFRGGQYSPHFCAYNRNKKSVALDLRSEFGQRALDALVQHSDVLLDNFRAGVLERLGFPDARLRQLNPSLIHCSITGFGPTGPYVRRPAYDAVAQALSGMSSLMVDPQDPRISGPTVADNVTGQYACNGIVAALLERERTGVARRVEVNMLDATIAFMPDPFAYYTQMGLVSDPYLRARTSQSYVFKCADGKMLAIHLSSREKFWEQFQEALERPDLGKDPRFASRMSRIEHYEGIAGAAGRSFAEKPRAYWLGRFAERDIPFAPIHDVTEVASDPQVMHLDSFMRLEHPTEGPVTSIRRPVWFDGSRDDQPTVAPPTLGEHTDEVLRALGIAAPGEGPAGG
jgi:formyl-CoA transferase